MVPPGQYAAAKAHGVLLTAGTDTPFPWIIPGISFHEELRLLEDAGIPTPAVLRIATLNGAAALRQDTQIGSIEPGKCADLVILHANPLEHIRNTEQIEWVIQGGKLLSQERNPTRRDLIPFSDASPLIVISADCRNISSFSPPLLVEESIMRPGRIFYSRPLRIAAITRGLRRPCMMATTHSGFLSGAYAIR